MEDNPEEIALFGYMRQMSFKFERLVRTTQKALFKNDMLGGETTLSRMLKLLLASPFCQPIQPDDYQQWNPYVKNGSGSKSIQLK